MRCSSTCSQTLVSRPVALTTNDFDSRARTLRNRLKASAAASNAGPRLADVAGKTIFTERGLLKRGRLLFPGCVQRPRRWHQVVWASIVDCCSPGIEHRKRDLHGGISM